MLCLMCPKPVLLWLYRILPQLYVSDGFRSTMSLLIRKRGLVLSHLCTEASRQSAHQNQTSHFGPRLTGLLPRGFLRL